MTKKQIEQLDKQNSKIINMIAAEADYDIEDAHVTADNILCDLLIKLGFNLTVDAYRKIDKWYS